MIAHIAQKINNFTKKMTEVGIFQTVVNIILHKRCVTQKKLLTLGYTRCAKSCTKMRTWGAKQLNNAQHLGKLYSRLDVYFHGRNFCHSQSIPSATSG